MSKLNIKLKDGTILKNINIALHGRIGLIPVDSEKEVISVLKGIIPLKYQGCSFIGDYVQYSSENNFGSFKWEEIEKYEFLEEEL